MSQEDGATYYQPVHHLRVGLHYEHELRLGPFDGQNSLGLLTDLAALRPAAVLFEFEAFRLELDAGDGGVGAEHRRGEKSPKPSA